MIFLLNLVTLCIVFIHEYFDKMWLLYVLRYQGHDYLMFFTCFLKAHGAGPAVPACGSAGPFGLLPT